ncbi:hypothetical protein JCM33374_g2487 [Metschnikowia sp. JCM 33374]|nr:hypothetical protein JCM33374_g2487 [Metschnikowia sp. JCM 33374]
MSKSVTARAWLYSWGGNSVEVPASVEEDAAGITEAIPTADPATNSTIPAEDRSISHTPVSETAETPSKPGTSTCLRPSSQKAPSVSEQSDTAQLSKQPQRPQNPPKSHHSRSPQRKPPTSLKHKLSTSSLSSYAPSNWLGWGSRMSRSNSVPEEMFEPQNLAELHSTETNMDDDDIDDDQTRQDVIEDAVDYPEEGAQPSGSGTQNPDDGKESAYSQSVEPPGSKTTSILGRNGSTSSLATKGYDSINTPDPETASQVSPRKKSWSFWNSAEDTPEKGELMPHSRITNTILKSTPSLPSRRDSQNKPDLSSHSVAANGQHSKDRSSKPDDAVLYKPHHSAEEFSKINTRKNENLAENMLVPDWNTCLKAQHHTSHLSTTSQYSSETATRGVQGFDLKNWKTYLSNISSRLGLTSSGDHIHESSSDDSTLSSTTAATTSNTDDTLHSMQERRYKLYGKSLNRLPPSKRACLPNFNKYYIPSHSLSSVYSSKRQKKSPEDSSSIQNPVSVSTDANGNLSINSNDPGDKKRYLSDLLRHKVGPLRKINKILIIGVHGFFPTRMIRPIIGSPKGTSSKFANEAEKAVIRYLLENDMMHEDETHGVSIQKIALEKEGKIFDRVEFFLKILTKWEKELNEADFIFIAAHSQGCVVSIILLARLIKRGILNQVSMKRIGILGMAGVNNGPFYGIDKSLFVKAYSAIEHESMIELFELTKFDSPQSLAYKDAVQTIVNMNVKLCLVGSINDQLVPLYSALASHVFHPNIYRACYIDSSAKTPAFIKTLISFCCQLQNMGYFDNNVIKEISPILAGPLTGGGHSKIYNDGKVYDLGIKFMLDTDDLVIPSSDDTSKDLGDDESDSELPVANKVYVREYNVGKIGTNPFILPWCLRGLIFNVQKNWRPVATPITMTQNAVQKSGAEEVQELYDMFDQWRPETKALKDLKFRLSGIRASKL